MSMDSIKYKPANFILGFLSWFAVNTAAWYMIWRLQPTIINNTSSADQKHLIDFWLNLLPWLFFLIIGAFLIVKKRWASLTGWVVASVANFVVLIFLLSSLSDTALIPPDRLGPYLLHNIPISALLIPNVLDLLYLWLL